MARGLVFTILVVLAVEQEETVRASACNGLVQTIDLRYISSGSISSPGYPAQYQTYENCQWLIKSRSDAQKILIYFTMFDLEECSSSCTCDSVEIYDGSSQYYSPLLLKNCGSNLPQPVYSTGRNILLKFTSDLGGSGKGFVAHYRALNNSSGCPSIVPGASAGVIYSPNFPSNYPNSRLCEWIITVPWNKKVNLKFMRFNLEGFGNCPYDYVEVRNYYGYNLIGKYCGSQIPPSITSSSSLRVRFESDPGGTRSGFLAFYHFNTSFTTEAPTEFPTAYFPTTPAAMVYHVCKYNSQTNLFVESSRSTSVASPDYNHGYYTRSYDSSCTFKFTTTHGYILELSFDKMFLTKCSSCSCGYVKVRDGSSSSDPLLGSFCDSNYDTVTSTGNHLFVEYYSGTDSLSSFRATVRSKKGKPVNIAAIAVPIVVAVVLFSIIFVVIKCTKIQRSAGPAGSSRVNEVPLQPLPPTILAPLTTQALFQNTEHVVSHPNAVPPATAPDQLSPSTDYSQGATNMAVDENFHV